MWGYKEDSVSHSKGQNIYLPHTFRKLLEDSGAPEWLSQLSIQLLTLAQPRIWWLMGWTPGQASCWQWRACLGVSFFLSLCPSSPPNPTRTCSLSLSQNKLYKRSYWKICSTKRRAKTIKICMKPNTRHDQRVSFRLPVLAPTCKYLGSCHPPFLRDGKLKIMTFFGLIRDLVLQDKPPPLSQERQGTSQILTKILPRAKVIN